ncbi:alpha/beta hydrolase family protein [Streptomyces sp. NPDC051051]|uniref:alpha/beta hydrolase n=1 Tax=Streptomyces sp. NPDC051051 TaxID=3155666 RepID=UPI00342067A7
MPLIACFPDVRPRRTRRFVLTFLVLVIVLLDARAAAPARSAGSVPGADDGQARITSVKKIDERTRDLTIRSPAVGRSVPVRVILPRRWNTDKKATFPVLYLLHGGDDDYTSWTRETDIEALSRKSDFLIVMPDGGRAGYYSDWRIGTPRWETFHTGELVRLMESKYRAGNSRVIAGLSMGGFGALNYAARHKGMFRYVAAMSSYVDLDDPAVRLSLALGSDRDGIDIKDVWGDPDKDRANWQAHNPSAMPRAFRGTRVHLSVGSGNPGPSDLGRQLDVVVVGAVAEAALPNSVKAFASSLRRAGVHVTTHRYDPGTHSWPYWQRELHSIWPTVTKVLGRHGSR